MGEGEDALDQRMHVTGPAIRIIVRETLNILAIEV